MPFQRQPGGKKSHSQSLTIGSGIDGVQVAEDAAVRFASQPGMGKNWASDLGLAVREAAANAVLHGCGGGTKATVTIRLRRTWDAVHVSVCDRGPGFDPEQVADPLADENLLRPSGRGLLLMRSLVDEVHFRQLHPGTELLLIKRRHACSQTGPDSGREALADAANAINEGDAPR
jgi:serine/threonine-protein kinase RsbW